MKTKHTPGPWEWLPATAGFYDAIVSKTSFVIEGEITSTANAKLIAAAPDLLEALDSILLWMENQADAQSKGGHATFDLMMLREQRDIARSAISKATGE